MTGYPDWKEGGCGCLLLAMALLSLSLLTFLWLGGSNRLAFPP